MSEIVVSPPAKSPTGPLPEPPPDDIAAAFEAMRRQLALLAAAVEGFAGRQERIEARDYAPDLARLVELQDRICGAIRTLAERPGVALTPEAFAGQLAKAAAESRGADHAALTAATARLDAMVERARTNERQRDALIWAWLFGAITVMAVVIVPQVIALWRN